MVTDHREWQKKKKENNFSRKGYSVSNKWQFLAADVFLTSMDIPLNSHTKLYIAMTTASQNG